MRINVGCGATPTAGWINFDNSPSVRLAQLPWAGTLLSALHLIAPAQRDYIAVAARHRIRWADATRRLPLPDQSVDVVYSSHMIGCLTLRETVAFLREARRVLQPGGILRLAEPVAGASEAMQSPRRRRAIAFPWLAGSRRYLAAHDFGSLSALVLTAGFSRPRTLSAGETTIPAPDGLDLREREHESFYMEAVASDAVVRH